MGIDWRSVNWSGLLPLLAAAFGWLLSEWGHVIRLHRDEQRAIGRVLSDLVIIHRHLIAIKALSDKFRAHTKFTEQQHLQLQLVMEAFFPQLDTVKARYDESIKVVMGIKPMLGYELAQQSELLPVLTNLKLLAATDEQSARVWAETSKHIEDTTRLEELITTLAWLHGWRTWLEVRRYLRTPLRELPQEMLDALKREGSRNRETYLSFAQRDAHLRLFEQGA